ncbi:MAG: hypothetical protein J5601_06010 [Elusimicrobiaceae bacterium]|nr:hypothetical protein [Elusimicrobiaceae bacterium]
MRKFYFLFLSICVSALSLSAAEFQPIMEGDDARFVHSHDASSLSSFVPNPLQVTIPVYKWETDTVTPKTSSVQCPAYALGPHWVMVGGTCLKRKYIPIMDGNLLLEGMQIPLKGNLFLQPMKKAHVMLIRVPVKNTYKQLVRRTEEQSKKITLLAFSSKDNVKLLNGQIVVGNEVIDKQHYTIQPGEIEVEDTHNPPAAPLFFVRNKQSPVVYWMAVKKRKESSPFVYFTEDDVSFIKETLQKEDPKEAPLVISSIRVNFK